MNIKGFIKSERFLFPVVFWILLFSIFYLGLYRFEGHQFAVRLTAFILVPIIIPVQLHSYIFDKYFLSKKYVHYILIEIIILAVFGYFIDLLEDFVDPNGDNATVVSIFLIQILYVGGKYVRKGTQQQFKLKELEAKQAQAELELLKSQVNPHFLFNSLNSIYSLTLKNSEKSSEAVLLLSDLMRYILESGKKELVPLSEELQFVDNYIKLETLRLGSNFDLDYKISGSAKNLYIAPMILITFIENMFKHGVSSTKENNIFSIQINITNDELHFSSTNNMVQKSNLLETKLEKTGIKNVKKRLEMIYLNNHNLTIENNKSKFHVDLQIKLNT